MRTIYLSLACIVLLCGCSGTIKGVKQDSKEAYESVKGAVHDGANWVGEKTGK